MTDDTISRAVAIDAIECIVDHHCITPYQTMRAAIDHAERIISGLPSAQPEQRWIPCSERLPGSDESFYVLCCDKHGEIMIGHVFACDDGETPYSAESEHEYMYDCVAWMPLPSPWEGGQDG